MQSNHLLQNYANIWDNQTCYVTNGSWSGMNGRKCDEWKEKHSSFLIVGIIMYLCPLIVERLYE